MEVENKLESRVSLRVSQDTYEEFAKIAQKRHMSVNGLLASLMEEYVEKNKYCLISPQEPAMGSITKDIAKSKSLLVAKSMDGESYFDLHETISQRLPFSNPSMCSLNGNMIVFGSPGSGKSVGIVSNAIMQSIANKDSMIIYDGSAQLYGLTIPSVIRAGYDIKIIDLGNPKHSNVSLNIFDDKYKLQRNRFVRTLFEDENNFFSRNSAELLATIIEDYDVKEIADVMEIMKKEYAINTMYPYKVEERCRLDLNLTMGQLEKYEEIIVSNKDKKDISVKNKTAIFIIGNSWDTLINKAVLEYILDAQMIGDEQIEDNFRTNIIIDDPISIGRIQNLDRHMATARSRKRNFIITFNTIEEMQMVYEDCWNYMLTNASLIFMDIFSATKINALTCINTNELGLIKKILTGNNMIVVPYGYGLDDYMAVRKMPVFEHAYYCQEKY